MTETDEIRDRLRIIEKKGMKNWYFRGVDVEILLAEIDRLTAERDGFLNGQQQLQDTCDGLQDSISKYAAERLELKEEVRRLGVELTAATCNKLPF